jgi:hypothetical protein
MGVKCFWIEPTGDASVEFDDGHIEIRPAEGHAGVTGWKHWRPRYRRPDTGAIFDALGSCPPGAMWDATWMHDCRGAYFLGGPNTDGRFLVVRLPNGNDWCIDSRASNCTKPDDEGHRCWIRHGDPPNLTVDKNGITCDAGAGSIQSGNYHGFLRNGELTT